MPNYSAPLKGSCLCGAVRWSANAEPQSPGHCHCLDCRKSSGTGHASLFMVSAEAFELDGELRYYAKPAASGNIIRRGFCPTCGSFVCSQNEGIPEARFIGANTLDDPERFNPSLVVWAKRQPSWDQHVEELPTFDSQPEIPRQ